MESELGTFSSVVDPFLPPPNNVVNLSGADVPFSPDFTGNIGMSYDIRMGEFTLTPRVDFSHQDETQAALWPDEEVTLEARDLVNAQLTFGPNSGKWSVVAWGTNITDEQYVSGIQNNGTLYYAAPPALYGVRAKINF
jgi:iron complex outermembrane receptor protein